jgi:hypothetical protein
VESLINRNEGKYGNDKDQGDTRGEESKNPGIKCAENREIETQRDSPDRAAQSSMWS